MYINYALSRYLFYCGALLSFPGGASGKEPVCNTDPLVEKILWRRAWQPIPVFFTGESHGQRSLVGYSL